MKLLFPVLLLPILIGFHVQLLTAARKMIPTATVLAVAIFSLATGTVSARETRTETFIPDHPISGQTSIEIILDTEVRVP